MRGRNFVVFVAIGGFAAAVNLLARIMFDQFTTYEIAILLAFPIATTTAFLLNRVLVFKPGPGGSRGQYLRFFAVNVLSLPQVFLISVGLARWLFPLAGMRFHADTIAHAIGLASPLVTSYWAHKLFSFRRFGSRTDPPSASA